MRRWIGVCGGGLTLLGAYKAPSCEGGPSDQLRLSLKPSLDFDFGRRGEKTKGGESV